jgi:chloride channel protein, CIC family
MVNKNPDPFYRKNELPMWQMGFLGIAVGIIAGFGAVIFRAMISFVHNLMFLGEISFYYDANVHTPESSWGIAVILVPVIGAIVVAFIVQKFAPEAKGHGVPEVMHAVYLDNGKIRPIVAVVKSIASAISIGTGGSVGREGPIVQIGSAFGSTLGQIVKMTPVQRNILIAAGAAGGIAATFNTPLGGLTFGIELMLVSISASSLFPVAISTVTACFIGRTFLGVEPSFYIPSLVIPSFSIIHLDVLLIFIPFGILIGICSIIFIKGLYFAEDLFDGMRGNYYTRHILGMTMVGILIYVLMRTTGHYYVQGVGYATIVDILSGMLANPWLLFLLVVLKLLATFLTLGSGASGGIFSPSLFLGASAGGAIGILLKTLLPGLPIDPTAFALAGMAGMISGTTGAVLTAIVMLTEMVHNMHFALPVMVTVSAAYAVRKMFCNESIYTMKLLRRGAIIPEGLQAAVSLSMQADSVMTKHFQIVSDYIVQAKPEEYLMNYEKDQITIVRRNEVILGVLKHVYTKNEEKFKDINNYIDKRFMLFSPKARLPEIMKTMKIRNIKFCLVTSRFGSYKATNIIGVIREKEALASSAKANELLQ